MRCSFVLLSRPRKRTQCANIAEQIPKIKALARYGFEALLKPRELAHGRLGRARRRSEAEGGFPCRYWGVAPNPIQGTFFKKSPKNPQKLWENGWIYPPDFLLKRGRHAHRSIAYAMLFCFATPSPQADTVRKSRQSNPQNQIVGALWVRGSAGILKRRYPTDAKILPNSQKELLFSLLRDIVMDRKFSP